MMSYTFSNILIKCLKNEKLKKYYAKTVKVLCYKTHMKYLDAN